MDELIRKLEAATGPSRELDGEIWRAIIGKPHDVWARNPDGVLMLQDPEDTIAYGMPPHFTTSLDAAVTVVPRARRWSVLMLSQCNRWHAAFEASVYLPANNARGWHGHAATPALALCIAALKSLSASSDKGTGHE